MRNISFTTMRLSIASLAVLSVLAVSNAATIRESDGRVFQMEMRDPTKNLLEVIADLDLYITVELISLAGLNETVEDEGPVTIFAPSNQGFQDKLNPGVQQMLETNATFRTDFLMNHAGDGTYMASDFTNDFLVYTEGYSQIRINVYQDGQVITANGNKIIKADQSGTNGVVHVIDAPLYPFPSQNIGDYMKLEYREYGYFYNLSKMVGLDSMLDSEGPYTIFAPPDFAFIRLGNATLDKLKKDTTLLKEVLEYHMVKGTYFASAFTSKNTSIPTLAGKDLTVSVRQFSPHFPPELIVNGKPCPPMPYPMLNGVIHMVESVLMPPSLRTLLRL